MRIRLYTLSKELGVGNKELVAKANELGIEVKSHSSSVDEAQVAMLRQAYGKPAAPPPAQDAPTPAAAPPKPAKPKAKPKAAAKPAKKKAGAPPPEERDKAEPGVTGERRRPPREKPKRRGAEIIGRVELPASETRVREYGPHVRVKERRGPGEPAAPTQGARPRRGGPRRMRRPGRVRRSSVAPVIARPSKITVDFPVTLRAFSHASGVKLDMLVRTLMQGGVMATLNDPLGEDVVQLLGAELAIEVQIRRDRDLESEVAEAQAKPDKPEDLVPRAPVVTFLGHVDHGKTSLLDAIRHSHVVDSESGGITQHIGAYAVRQGDHVVVFLDTPGHEAFTAMRARGAQVTDIAVLVVAADDGVMPQTEEAVNHAKAAGVPIVVAINKIDLPGSNPDRVMQQFTALELLPAKWGGDTEFVQVSAVTQDGIPDLVDTLAIQAEVLELKANPNRPASGTILEAHLSEGRGCVATVLVMDGTLKIGDMALCGKAYGRIRSIHDDRGRAIEHAGPATPVEVAGLSAVPAAGDAFVVVGDLEKAREIAATRARREREANLAEHEHVTLDNLFATLDRTELNEIRVILKADVQGSLEVLRKTLTDLSTDEVGVNMLHAAVGGINDSDVLLADASDAIIIGFHVVAEPSARLLAEAKRIDIRPYNVIYQLKDDMKAALEDRLEPERRETVVAHAEVRQVFRVSRSGSIAGCYVTDGRINRTLLVRLIRDNIVIYEGKMGSLRRFKDDVREVQPGMECGIKIADYNDVKEGDTIELYEVTEIKRHL